MRVVLHTHVYLCISRGGFAGVGQTLLFAPGERKHTEAPVLCAPSGDRNQKAKVAGYGEVQVNTGPVDQMWADVKRWVLKQMTSQRLVVMLCLPVVLSGGFEHLVKM